LSSFDQKFKVSQGPKGDRLPLEKQAARKFFKKDLFFTYMYSKSITVLGFLGAVRKIWSYSTIEKLFFLLRKTNILSKSWSWSDLQIVGNKNCDQKSKFWSTICNKIKNGYQTKYYGIKQSCRLRGTRGTGLSIRK